MKFSLRVITRNDSKVFCISKGATAIYTNCLAPYSPFFSGTITVTRKETVIAHQISAWQERGHTYFFGLEKLTIPNDQNGNSSLLLPSMFQDGDVLTFNLPFLEEFDVIGYLRLRFFLSQTFLFALCTYRDDLPQEEFHKKVLHIRKELKKQYFSRTELFFAYHHFAFHLT